jgi:hypothetical protein
MFWTEASLFYEFGERAKQVHGQHLDDWDILFYMHHGVSIIIEIHARIHDREQSNKYQNEKMHRCSIGVLGFLATKIIQGDKFVNKCLNRLDHCIPYFAIALVTVLMALHEN